MQDSSDLFPVPFGLKTAMKSLASLYLLKEGIDRLLWKWNVSNTEDPLGSIQVEFFGTLYNHGTKWQSTDETVKVCAYTFPDK